MSCNLMRVILSQDHTYSHSNPSFSFPSWTLNFQSFLSERFERRSFFPLNFLPIFFSFRQDEEINTMARELEIQSQITTAVQVFIYITVAASSFQHSDSQPKFRVFHKMWSTYGKGALASWLVRLIERSRFEPWPWTLCCVLGQDTNSHTASLHPGVQMSTGEFDA